MNIYHVERTDTHDWDEYSDFVVVANSEEEARSFKPAWDDQLEPIGTDKDTFDSWVSYDKTEAHLVGKANDEYTEPTLICASFHAG